MTARPYLVGLTGSIGMGKTETAKLFAELGVPVYDADAAVHRLYEKGGAAVPEIEKLFPHTVEDGRVNREKLAKEITAIPDGFKKLEAIVHPLVRRRIARFLADSEVAGAEIAVVDIPLLFENGVDYGLDKVAVTHVAEAELRRRALARPGMSVEKLDAILARQTPQAEKIRRADILFDTGGPRENVAMQVKALVDSVRRGEK